MQFSSHRQLLDGSSLHLIHIVYSRLIARFLLMHRFPYTHRGTYCFEIHYFYLLKFLLSE